MDHRDLDTYLMARRQQKWTSVVSVGALILAAIAGMLLYAGIGGALVRGIFFGSIGGAFLVNSEFGLLSAFVTRKALLSIIEHQISRDPEALGYLAAKH